ncbi:hypothetical protein EDB81DRAFT_792901 [Dactylonectria macrodidyma]|uniref:Uncharacterized protein n=1 Tax=Dactylonectria macrodidyma TaxID=307937 RepID=A0A9P9EYN9_9HYPO|nr:hypothetical protein EDB81DRAFT_792901 [Dactylonectria macrodidyma]
MDPLCRVVLSKTASAAPAPVPAQASAPAPAPPSSPSLSSPPSLSPPRSSSASLTSSSKTNSPRSDTGHSADASYAMDRHQTPPQLNTNARPSWIYANSQKDAQQSIQQSILPYRAAAPRGVTSPNWRAAQQHPVDVGVWGHAAQSNYTLGSVALPKVETPSGGLEGYAYCLDRGNGQYTRLIPADVLPPLNEIPARQPGPPGMVILPDLQSAPPQGVAPLNRPVTIMTWRDRDGPASDSLQVTSRSRSPPQPHISPLLCSLKTNIHSRTTLTKSLPRLPSSQSGPRSTVTSGFTTASVPLPSRAASSSMKCPSTKRLSILWVSSRGSRAGGRDSRSSCESKMKSAGESLETRPQPALCRLL